MENNIAHDTKQLWAVYAWWSCVLVLKMNALTWFTGRIRVARQVIHSEEDRMWMKGPNVILCPTGGGHEDVDRIREAHRHDLETVLPYLLITPIWLSTSPSFPLARMILTCFAIVSILYTLVHMQILNVHHYFKAILSALELSILIYISIASVCHYANHL
ncbi:prostaglandin E synthase [Calliopsis andreniformis]|uniref:prostaglandin E synthase n=1 Tax=Calliopsis andreniformis TaxID=337506 RepID=UPI003FCCE1A5